MSYNNTRTCTQPLLSQFNGYGLFGHAGIIDKGNFQAPPVIGASISLDIPNRMMKATAFAYMKLDASSRYWNWIINNVFPAVDVIRDELGKHISGTNITDNLTEWLIASKAQLRETIDTTGWKKIIKDIWEAKPGVAGDSEEKFSMFSFIKAQKTRSNNGGVIPIKGILNDMNLQYHMELPWDTQKVKSGNREPMSAFQAVCEAFGAESKTAPLIWSFLNCVLGIKETYTADDVIEVISRISQAPLMHARANLVYYIASVTVLVGCYILTLRSCKPDTFIKHINIYFRSTIGADVADISQSLMTFAEGWAHGSFELVRGGRGKLQDIFIFPIKDDRVISTTNEYGGVEIPKLSLCTLDYETQKNMDFVKVVTVNHVDAEVQITWSPITGPTCNLADVTAKIGINSVIPVTLGTRRPLLGNNFYHPPAEEWPIVYFQITGLPEMISYKPVNDFERWFVGLAPFSGDCGFLYDSDSMFKTDNILGLEKVNGEEKALMHERAFMTVDDDMLDAFKQSEVEL